MHIRKWLSIAALLGTGIYLLPAQSTPKATLTVTVTGKLGPVLSGFDPLFLSGQAVVLTITSSESLSPVAHNAHAASYAIPGSSVAYSLNTASGTATASSKITAKLSSTADIGELSTTIDLASILGTINLAPGSWKQSVLKHPRAFSPSPQNITAATSANGAGSKVQYTFDGEVTVLGITGTASSSN